MPQGLEVVPPSDPEWTATATEASSKPGEKVEAAGGQVGGLDGPTDAARQVWWKRKRLLIGIVIVIVLGIALGVGLGVGLTTNKFVRPSPPLRSIQAVLVLTLIDPRVRRMMGKSRRATSAAVTSALQLFPRRYTRREGCISSHEPAITALHTESTRMPSGRTGSISAT